MAAEWYYKMSGETVGPLSVAELRQHAQDGKIHDDAFVRRGDDGRWVAAEKVKGLLAVNRSSMARLIKAETPTLPPSEPPSVFQQPPPPEVSGPARLPEGQTDERPPSVPMPWVICGGIVFTLLFVAILVATRSSDTSGPSGYSHSGGTYSPSDGGGRPNGGSKTAKMESLRFQITQLQEEEKRIEKRVEGIDAEQRRESEKLRLSTTRGADGIAEALRYQRESEGRNRLKNLRYEDLSKVRKQIKDKKKELEELERSL